MIKRLSRRKYNKGLSSSRNCGYCKWYNKVYYDDNTGDIIIKRKVICKVGLTIVMPIMLIIGFFREVVPLYVLDWWGYVTSKKITSFRISEELNSKLYSHLKDNNII